MSHDVVIAGAGPVGLMLACELRLAGSEAVVLEDRPEPNPHAPGVALNGGVVELLEMRGLMDACRTDGFEFPMAHFAHIWLDPGRLAGRYPYNFAMAHSRLIHHLTERARSLGVDLRFGHRVRGVTQDADGVDIRVEGPDGESTVRGRYLAGCDGADSAVRQAVGVGFTGNEEPFHGTVSDFVVEPDSVLNQHMGAKEYPAGLFAVSPVGPGTVRVLTGEFGVEPPSRDGVPALAEIRAAVHRLAGVEFTGDEPTWSARWFNVTRLAERYRAGRVFLAGEAAHTHFPLGGQALSTGMDDAVNLGWKLAADLAGYAPEGLLDTYEAERRPVARRACTTVRAQVALLHPLTELRDVVTELVRFPDVNEYFVRMAGGTDTRISFDDDLPEDAHPLLGRRIPGVAAAVQSVPELAEAWASGRGVLLDLSDDPEDGRLDITGWTDRVSPVRTKPLPGIDAEAVLLRPDGRVVWAARSGQGGDGLAEALRSRFGTPTPA
ncbi:FAD-dependent monooxygenase [Streptomyces olivaceus]|uniref:FAD-dependent monooxygenase n=1 Tax=Streptomyces olivaceus TaxID=47716 RepID=UPI001CCBF99C|nr:FAD-dependent monooxygenase [Streptomyces olivaceus]MBZ6197899.1 FAD-dependent monooxygenase [Streptomyces olivaceus]MBZ6204433.1 FAD-dependent monooxygenase [Streptomyces olivaceus]MBZ6309575.1 FAD-dependent monooxygenase [Streptomyces olivaceus]MBZ6323360.1 FAD-dependent monooxygenase [Streptomyces olivaceus]